MNRFLLILLVQIPLQAKQPEAFPQPSSVLFAWGDNPLWAHGIFDDEQWDHRNWSDLRFCKQNLWIRCHMELPGPPEFPVGLYVNGLFSAEIFWDGEPIGAKGMPGQDATSEEPGPMEQVVWLSPDMLQGGPHLLAIRLSNHHLQLPVREPIHFIGLGRYQSAKSGLLTHYAPALATLGALILAAIYFLVHYVRVGAQERTLWLTFICLGALGQLSAEISKGLIAYTYSWHLPRLILILTFASLFGFSLIMHLGQRFQIYPRRLAWLGLILSLAAMSLPAGYDLHTLRTLLINLLVALFLSAIALYRQHKGAIWAMMGLIFFGVLLVGTGQMFLDRYFFIAVWGLLVVLFYLELNELNRVRRAQKTAELSRDRLALELLKKQLQPHFLMNSLTSLAEWLEQDPARGAAMMESLAEECRLMNEVASKAIIPASTELALCRAHLELFGARQDREYRLETHGIGMNDWVPPAVFHTLLENAMTHNQYSDAVVTFRLEGLTSKDGCREYRFYSPPGLGLPKPSRGTGTGTAYIRSRLSEAFGDGWCMLAGPLEDGGWQTQIQIWGAARAHINS